MTDPISDFLTRIRNAVKAHHRVVEIPANKVKKEMTKILHEQGYILNFKFDDAPIQGSIKIALKYDQSTGQSPINNLRRVSSPGLRRYVGHKDIPKVNNGLGIAIISTSRGIMTDKAARNLNIGGEVLCFVS